MSFLLSLVIPTKNRPKLLQKVVDNILSQQPEGVEIVVIDNSDKKNEFYLSNLNLCDDRKVKIIKTGGLSMPENWDFALNQCQGDYVTIINDKTIYRDGSISKITSILKDERPDFLTWVIGGGEFQKFENSSEPIKVDNWSVINYALECRIDKYQRLAPRGTNSAIKNELLTSLRKKYGNFTGVRLTEF